MKYHLFLFFRDFRVKDNIGLWNTMINHENIIPIFIFNDEQINPTKNKYFSHNCVQFMCEGLQDLNNEFKKNKKQLYTFHGKNTIECLTNICNLIDIDGISYNMDYTPFSQTRQKQIKQFCSKFNISHFVYEDYLLAPIGSFLKSDQTHYGIYTPFRNNVLKKQSLIPVIKNTKTQNIILCPELLSLKCYHPISELNKFYNNNSKKLVYGSRKDAIKRLNSTKFMNYDDNRNTLSLQTSLLSAYIKFGLLSIREVFWFFKDYNQYGLIDQLLWREFYYYVAFYNPKILTRGKCYNEKYENVKWVNSKKTLEAWKNGTTGYPIVDAAMIEMNTTGYMHNRARLISSNFLNRMLGQNWKKGEEYFAQTLTDYDPCVNNGNWQWIASCGTDPKPYFQRLFNPWLQSYKVDKDAEYIKKWLPQLKNIPAKELHEWENHFHKYNLTELDYYKPIVDYKEARQRSIEQYKEVL